MTAKDKEKEDSFSQIVAIVSDNKFAYACFAVSLIICFYTIYNVEDYQQRINNQWMNFINENCYCSANFNPNVSFKLMTPKEMIDSIGESNYNTTIDFNNEPEYYFDFGGMQIGNESFD
jgi:hypothetical protein